MNLKNYWYSIIFRRCYNRYVPMILQHILYSSLQMESRRNRTVDDVLDHNLGQHAHCTYLQSNLKGETHSSSTQQKAP